MTQRLCSAQASTSTSFDLDDEDEASDRESHPPSTPRVWAPSSHRGWTVGRGGVVETLSKEASLYPSQ